MQIGAPTGFQNRTGIDVDGVMLNKNGLGVHIVKGDGASGKAVVTHLHRVLIPGKIRTGSGGKIEISPGNDMGVCADGDLICRPYSAFSHTGNEGSESISLSLDKSHNLPLPSRRDVNFAHAFQVGTTNFNAGLVGLRHYRSITKKSGQAAASRKHHFLIGDDIIQGSQGEVARCGRTAHYFEGSAVPDFHQSLKADERVTVRTTSGNESSGFTLDIAP